MTGRTRKILGRFPNHMRATRSGKQLVHVSESLARDLDVMAADLAGIRRAHRLGEVGQIHDALLIGGLHSVRLAELALLFHRFAKVRELISQLAQASDDDQRRAVAEPLIALWGIGDSAPRLPLYAPAVEGGQEPDLEAAAKNLIKHAEAASGHLKIVDAVRRRIASTSSIHAKGNGTVSALLSGAAAALDVAIGPIRHSTDRFWHAAEVVDQQRLTRPPTARAIGARESIAPSKELLGIEENPLTREETDELERCHTERFEVLRQGFDRALLRVRVTGLGSGAWGPMVVNRDEGHGIGYSRKVNAGETLVFTEEGRAQLGTDDVTSFAFAWKGACFADSKAPVATDFVFDKPREKGARQAAEFARATPAAALDREYKFPHDGASLPMPGIGVGKTRLAFFSQQAHYSARTGSEPTSGVVRVTPRTGIGFFDESFFAPGPGEKQPKIAKVSLSWLEHGAYSVRLLVPQRFRSLADKTADPEALQVLQQIVRAVNRFRPAGVHVEAEYIDDRWVLGEGILLDAVSDDPVEQLRSGTVLWTAPSEAQT